jgi:hypothetical protein
VKTEQTTLETVVVVEPVVEETLVVREVQEDQVTQVAQEDIQEVI